MFAFFENLHIDLSVAIEKRKSFDATNRETISVQNIDFLDVAADNDSDENFEKNVLFERSRTISDASIEKNMSFDDERDVIDDSIIDFDDVKDDEMID
ncbi:hypothetical protein G7Y79_00115g101750 [Physcia stellaris]|nr:hypothetical protein G7Y79_00115g101750 [Physcia stellaris]